MDSPICPNCGLPVSADAPAGLCLSCLARLGADGPPALPDEMLPSGLPSLPGPIHYFGDYELIEELGRGGMGVVYRARQVSLNRQVAVKMILPGPYASEDLLRRFRAEAETIAQLQHPNVVGIFEVGEHQGQPYFSMEYVAGTTLAGQAKDGPLAPPEAARQVATVARAIQVVHAHGILHRDLKPTNILVDELCQPHVTDFGMAKRLDGAGGFTLTGQTLGTPAYMPPEQIVSRSGGVTVRSDVYSLGAVLYHLLTGRPPFMAQTHAETFHAVLNGVPVPPGLLIRGLPLDLDTICLCCLAKEPERRYGSAAALAEDLDRWLAGKPILARPVNRLERTWMWARRNPMLASLGALLALSVLGGTAGIGREWRLSELQRKRAEASARELLDTTLRVQGQKAEQLFDEHHPQDALATLAAVVRLDPSNRVAPSRLRSALTYRDFPQPLTPLLGDTRRAYLAAFSPDGRRIVTAQQGSQIRVWDPASGLPVGPPLEHAGKVESFALSLDGQTVMSLVQDDGLYVWNAQTAASQCRLPCSNVVSADLSPDGTHAAAGLRNGIVIVFDCRQALSEEHWNAHTGAVQTVAFSKDGRFLATGSEDHTARLWDARNGFRLLTHLPHEWLWGVSQVVPSPDGRRLLTYSGPARVRLWEIPEGRLIANLDSPNLASVVMAFSPDGTRALIGTEQGPILLFDAATGQQLLRYEGHNRTILDIDFSPDGQWAVSSSRDNTAQIWDAHTGEPLCEPVQHENAVSAARFDPKGQRLVTASPGGGTYLWDIGPKKALPLRVGERESVLTAALAQDGARLYTVSTDGAVRVWNPRSAVLLRTVRQPSDPLRLLAFFDQPVERVLLVEGSQGAFLVNFATNQTVRLEAEKTSKIGNGCAFSLDGRRVAVAARDTIFICDARTGKRLLPPLRCDSAITRNGHDTYSLQFSPDGRSLLAACYDSHARVWDASTGAILADFPHEGPVVSAEFSPDGTRVLTAAFDNTARIWALTNTASPLRVLRHRDWLTKAVLSPDGRQVLTGTMGNSAYVWDAETGAQTSVSMPHRSPASPLSFARSVAEVLTRGELGSFRRWDAQTGLPMSEPYFIGGRLSVAWTPGWDCFAAADGTREALIWRETLFPNPCPDWLPSLGESVAGLRYAANGAAQPVAPDEFLKLKERLLASTAIDPWTRWAQWFFANPDRRTCAWDSDSTMRAHAESLRARDRLADLREALRYTPANGLLVARLARRTLEETNNPCARPEADFLSRRAVELDPGSAEVKRLRADVSAQADFVKPAK